MNLLNLLESDEAGANAAMAKLAKNVTPKSALAGVVEEVDPQSVGRTRIIQVDEELRKSRKALESVINNVGLGRNKKSDDKLLND